MKLVTLRCKNLFSLKKVDLHLRNRGLTLVTGFSYDEGSANGSGKSTIANKAIIWTLFGQTVGGTKGDDVVNKWIGKDEKSSGVLTIIDNDGRCCRITRTRNPASLTYERADNKGGWIDVSRRHQNETQAMINEDIGRDFSAFVQTDFFGQGRNNDFLKLMPAQQTEILEQILPINELEEWAKYAKESQVPTKTQLNERNDMIAHWNGALAETYGFVGGLERKNEVWCINQQKELKEAEEELTIFIDGNKDAIDEKYKLEAELLEIPLADTDKAKEAWGKAIENIKEAEQGRKNCLDVIFELKQLRVKYSSKLSCVNDNCPTCNQPLPEENRNALIMEQHQITGKISEIDQQLSHADDSLRAWGDHLGKLHDSNLVCEMKYDTAVKNKFRAAEIKDKIAAIEKVIDSERRGALEAKIALIKASKNPYEGQITEKKRDMEAIKKRINSYQDFVDDIKEELEHLQFWAKTFGKDFKTFLFQRACPFLQVKTEEHLNGLGNEQLRVEFSTTRTLKSGDERSGFSVNVYSETGGNGYDSLSGGEQQMVSFAVGLALADLAETQVKGGSNILILDEPFMALDERNSEALVNYLTNTLSSKRETILLISNEDNLKSLIPERIHVEKSGGISSVQA